MSDFCKQCSLDNFGKDFGDLANITTAKDIAQNKSAAVICEGCGPIQVDVDGTCLSENCYKKGKPGHGQVCQGEKDVGAGGETDTGGVATLG